MVADYYLFIPRMFLMHNFVTSSKLIFGVLSYGFANSIMLSIFLSQEHHIFICSAIFFA